MIVAGVFANLFVNRIGLLHPEFKTHTGGNQLREPTKCASQLVPQLVIEHERRHVHHGHDREYVEHRERGVVPLRQRRRMIERPARDRREVDWTEDVGDADHGRPLTTAVLAVPQSVRGAAAGSIRRASRRSAAGG